MRHARIATALALVLVCLATASPAARANELSPDQLDQLVAPIALFPDNLLSQVLMAASYPLEIVEADRWAQANRDLNPTEREERLSKQTWDPSVTSLTAFPDVLRQMSSNLDWTETLGEAFVGSQKSVLAAVQRMRLRAEQAGNLQSTPQQNVSTSDGAIVIAPPNPQVVYEPIYNPTVVYGSWAPPSWYWPSVMTPWPGYVGGSVVSFGLGVAAGAFMFGGCSWSNGSVWVNPHRYGWGGYRGSYAYNNIRVNNLNVNRVSWQYNNYHRGNVNFHDTNLQQRYGARTGWSGYNTSNLRGYGGGRSMTEPHFAPSATHPTSGYHPSGGTHPSGAYRPSGGARAPAYTPHPNAFSGYSSPRYENHASTRGADSLGRRGANFSSVPRSAPSRPVFGGGGRSFGGGRRR